MHSSSASATVTRSAILPVSRGIPPILGWRGFPYLAVGLLLAAVVTTYSVEKGATPPVVGEALGAVGLLLVVACLLLTLRFPQLAQRLGGLEAMYTLHRFLGLAAYLTLLLHPILLANGKGWIALTPFNQSAPFLAGWVSLALLMVVLLFTFLLRPRGYAIWRNLHWLTVPAFLLMAWHTLHYQADWGTGAKLAVNSILLLGVLVPLARYAVVDRGLGAIRYRVTRVSHPTPGVADLTLQPTGCGLPVIPGQFVFARFIAGNNYRGCPHFHPFTASTVLDDGGLRLSIKASGPCTTMMQGLAPGAEALVQGPFGRLFDHVRRGTQVWIAGGIGITPFLARARMLGPDSGGVKLFYLFTREEDAAFLDELRVLAKQHDNFELYPVITHGLTDAHLPVLDALLPPWDDKAYVMCGPPAMIDNVRRYLEQHSVPPTSIHEERFDFR